MGFFSVVELQSIFEFMFYVWEWCLGLLGSSFNPFCVELFGFSSFYTFNPFCVILSVGEGVWFLSLFLIFNPFCVRLMCERMEIDFFICS